MDTEPEIRKKFEEIRQERQEYTRDRILDAWESMVLFRNAELARRLDRLEERASVLETVNYLALAVIGTVTGLVLAHMLFQ